MTSKSEMDALAGGVLATINALTDAPVYENGVKTWMDQGQEPMTREAKLAFKKAQYRQAQCPVCSIKFNEHEGIDVEQGEVCCSKQCAENFETL